MLRLNSKKYRGILYHFCKNWTELNSIVKKGIKIQNQETTWEDNRFEQDEQGRSSVVSFTRNPSGIIEQAVPEWRYAVILDGEKLDDTKGTFKPQHYLMIPGTKTLSFFVRGSGDAVMDAGFHNPNSHAVLSAQEYQKIKDWAYQKEKEGKATVQENVGNYREFRNLVVMFSIGTETNRLKGPLASNLVLMNWDEVPNFLIRILQRVANEEEERYFNYKLTPDGNIDISKALLGVLIPDVDYFSKSAETFRTKHPNLPMYIYRDRYVSPNAKDSDLGKYEGFNYGRKKGKTRYEEFKKMLQLNPEVKELYRIPG